MAVTYYNNETTEIKYQGRVVGTREHMWMDGMLEVFAVVWNLEEHCYEEHRFAYIGADGHNLQAADCKVDFTQEVARDIIRTTKKQATEEFCREVQEYKTGIRKGVTAEVVRGRKIKKGTVIKVFWTGMKPTYASQLYHDGEMELIAGGHTQDGQKVFIKAEYLKNLDHYESPNAAQRRQYIRDYISSKVSRQIIEAAAA